MAIWKTNDVPIRYWSLLEPCLKEALPNVARHSDATKVDVQLDVTDTIVQVGAPLQLNLY